MHLRKYRLSLLGLILLGLVQPLMAADSLCVKGETNYFSCGVKGGKFVSLCGDADITWLQYRFGLPGKMEFIYPANRKDSLSKFEGDYGTALQGQVRWTSISFVNAGIGYKVEYLVPEGREPFEGVRVGDPKKMDIKINAPRKKHYQTADIPCTKESNHDHSKFDELARFIVDQMAR